MSWLGPEAIADAVIAYIEANMAAKLTSVNARFDVPLDLPVFAAIRISDPDREHEMQFPVLYVMPDTGAWDMTPGYTTANASYPFEFAVLARQQRANDESAPESVKRASLRYILAVWEMLVEMHSHSTNTYHVGGGPLHWGSDGNPPRFYYSPIYTRRSGEYLGDARLQVGLEHTEA